MNLKDEKFGFEIGRLKIRSHMRKFLIEIKDRLRLSICFVHKGVYILF